MKKQVLALAFITLGLPALAQMSPVGLWRSIDDNTGAARSEVRIVDSGATGMQGKIEKRLTPGVKPEDVCEKCDDDRKAKPIQGLEIIRGAKKAEGKDVWEGGKILDPESGREYGLKMTPIEGGKKLDLRASFGPFGRTQTWIRIE
ncbi:MAG: DUF2147 domain-containing protein [Pseudomonadota bacterium]